jgi:hypothetical protein
MLLPSLALQGTAPLRSRSGIAILRPTPSVTDVRLVKPDFKTPNQKKIEIAQQKLVKEVSAIICVGLTRPWTKPGDDRRRHWLQVNNIHFSDDPLGLDFE